MPTNAQEITDRIDAALAAGTVPWLKPWIGGESVARNLSSKRPYTGINVLLLALSPNAGPWWVTYKQAQALGGNVRKGEKGTRIFFWADYCVTRKTDGRKCPERNNREHRRDHHRLIQRGYTVFNAETQCDGLEDRIPPTQHIERHANGACAIGLKLVDALDGYELASVTEGGDSAHYVPATDSLNLPPTSSFIDGRRYYWAALHELVHSTGAESRLARDFSGGFGSKEYAREELVAEIGACIAARELGFEPDIEQSAAYIAGWRQAIANDPSVVQIAAGRASKAVQTLFGHGAEEEEQES